MALSDNQAKHPINSDGFLSSLRFANAGILAAIQTERNLRIQMTVAIIIIIVGIVVKLEVSEWLWLFLAIALVLIAELLNTVIETLVDLITRQQFHLLAKRAKDIGAGISLLAAIFSIIIGLLIFVPKFL